jgi:uncharacterized protein
VIIVSDTSPLLNLAVINQLDLLHELYQEIIIPPVVYNELVVAGWNMPGAIEVEEAAWIQVKSAQNKSVAASLHLQLDPGEAEAIALAIELSADLLLVDERKARVVATQLGLPVVGLLGVLVEAKQKRHVTAVRPILDRLIQEASFWISPELYQHVVSSVGE